MSVNLVMAPPAGGKTEYCMERITEIRNNDPFAPIKVIVADKQQMYYWKKKLSRISGNRKSAGFIGTEIISFTKLSLEIINAVPESPCVIPPHLNSLCINEAIKEAASEKKLRYFLPVSAKPGVSALFEEAITELIRSCITPDDLFRCTDDDPKVFDLWLVYQKYLSSMKEREWISQTALVEKAADFLDAGKVTLLHSPLLVADGFDSFTTDCLHLLKALAPYFSDILITIPGRIGVSRISDIQLENEETRIRDIFPDIKTIYPAGSEIYSRHIGCRLASNVLSADKDSKNVIQTDPDFMMIEEPFQHTEVKSVLRQVKDQIVNHGISAGECAVYVPDMASYAPILRRVGKEMGIPLYFEDHRSFSSEPAAALLKRLLSLSIDDYQTETLLAVLRSPFLSGCPDPQDDDDDSYERDLYLVDKAAHSMIIISGIDEWNDAFAVLERESEKDHEKNREESPYELPKPEKIRRIAESFRKFIEMLTPPTGTRSRDQWFQWLNDLLDKTRFYKKTDQAFINSFLAFQKKIIYAEENMELPEINYAEFVGELNSAMESSVISIQGNPSDRVYIGDISRTGGVRRKLTALMGFSEGLFPRSMNENLLINKKLRTDLNLREVPDQSIHLLHALTRSEKVLIISRPRKTDNGEEWPSSIYWQSVLKLLTRDNSESGYEKLVSSGVLSAGIAAPASIEELAFETARKKMPLPEWLSEDQKKKLSEKISTASYALERVSKQNEGLYGPEDDQDLREALNDPSKEPMPYSCSVIETFLSCPFRYFLEKKIKLEPTELPSAGLDAMQLGSLNHKVLEMTFPPGTVYSSPEEALEQAKKVIPEIFENAPKEFDFRESDLWKYEKKHYAQKLLDTIEAMFRQKKMEMSSRWRCLGTEVPFGYPEQGGKFVEPLIVNTESGKIAIRGWIDRLDIRDDGLLRVVDYKTGGSAFTKAEIEAGSHIQGGIYAAAAVEALHEGNHCIGMYWSVNQKKVLNTGTKEYDAADENVPGIEFLNRFKQGIDNAEFLAVQSQNHCLNSCPAYGWCRNFQKGG